MFSDNLNISVIFEMFASLLTLFSFLWRKACMPGGLLLWFWHVAKVIGNEVNRTSVCGYILSRNLVVFKISCTCRCWKFWFLPASLFIFLFFPSLWFQVPLKTPFWIETASWSMFICNSCYYTRTLWCGGKVQEKRIVLYFFY